MKTVAVFRQLAEECRKLAAKPYDPKDKGALVASA
jgi:hypothetical protein